MVTAPIVKNLKINAPVAIPLGECLAADPGRLPPLTVPSAIPFLGDPGGRLSATDMSAAIGVCPLDWTATTVPSGGLTVRLPRGETVLVTEVGTELTVLKAGKERERDMMRSGFLIKYVFLIILF